MNPSPTSVECDPESTGRAPTLSDATSFEIDRQSGQTISNIGGDQTVYYGDRSPGIRMGKVLAALGLLLSLIGSALLVPIGLTTMHGVLHAHADGAHAPWHYVPGYWPAAVGLLVGGYVVRHFARIMLGR